MDASTSFPFFATLGPSLLSPLPSHSAQYSLPFFHGAHCPCISGERLARTRHGGKRECVLSPRSENRHFCVKRFSPLLCTYVCSSLDIIAMAYETGRVYHPVFINTTYSPFSEANDQGGIMNLQVNVRSSRAAFHIPIRSS